MGGYGSGRQSGRATVEGCRSLVLDINRVMRPVMEALRRRDLPTDAEVQTKSSCWWWTRHGESEPLAEVEVTLTLYRTYGFATLSYDVGHCSRRTGPQAHRVQIISTPCRFGGRRWWWICPATGQRVAKLYLPRGGSRFLCRRAYRLVYSSQREDWIGRAHRRAARLHRSFDNPQRMAFCGTPAKPKWMRWSTYERLTAKLREVDVKLEEGMERVAARLLT